MALSTTASVAQTEINGVIYTNDGGSATVSDINNDSIPSDSTLKLPAKVKIGDYELPVSFKKSLKEEKPAIKKIIFLGDPLVVQASAIMPYLPNLEEVITNDGSGVYKAMDGVLYSKKGADDYYKLVLCPRKWDPTNKQPSHNKQLFQESTKHIESYACYMVERLTENNELTIPSRVEHMGERAFYKTNITSLKFETSESSSQLYLNWEAFARCKRLASVDFNYRAVGIGDKSFGDCSKLSNLNLNGVTEISYQAFSGCDSLKNLTIPGSVKEIYDGAFMYTALEKVKFSGDNDVDLGVGVFLGCRELSSVTLPSGLKSINSWDFKDCGNLKKLTLPESLKSIKREAFLNSGLTHLMLPKNLEITGLLFMGASKLTK